MHNTKKALSSFLEITSLATSMGRSEAQPFHLHNRNAALVAQLCAWLRQKTFLSHFLRGALRVLPTTGIPHRHRLSNHYFINYNEVF